MDDVDDKDFSPYQATTKESMMRRCSLRQKKKKLSGQNNFVAQGKGVGGGGGENRYSEILEISNRISNPI